MDGAIRDFVRPNPTALDLIELTTFSARDHQTCQRAYRRDILRLRSDPRLNRALQQPEMPHDQLDGSPVSIRMGLFPTGTTPFAIGWLSPARSRYSTIELGAASRPMFRVEFQTISAW